MNEILGVMAQVLLAAAAGEGIIEFIPAPILDWLGVTDKNKRTVILNVLSALLGIGIALNFELGIFTFMGAIGKWEIVDMVITGALVGRGSNWIHGFIRGYILKSKDYILG